VYSGFRAETLLGFLLILLFSGSFGYGDDKIVEVVGIGECGDCKESNVKSSHALSGLRVTVDCKLENGKFKTRGVGELNREGNFKISLPQEILKDGKLTEECYTQLRNAENTPCAVHGGLDAAKIGFLLKSDQRHTFGPTGKLKFSSAVCTSAFLWPFFKYPPLPQLPPLPKNHPWLGHPFPQLPPLPPKVYPSFPFPPKMPIGEPLTPPSVDPPVIDPPPVFKPPPVPVYKPEPKPPVYKPEPKPKPKPPPPPVPDYEPKPKPPVVNPPPVPIYEPPPLPPPVNEPSPKILPPPIPIFKPLPPFYKKPCPPFSLPKLPPFPTLPPKSFHHPIIGDLFPPLPPIFSHP
ncbi:hypothetical protein Ccrd_001904, partial [Cynara cardunculus var. scolymus]